ncbi:MAG: MoaD/ThiS family protein [Robiginitomaculum sp.]
MATILFFGKLSDVSGALTVDLPQDVRSGAALKKWLGGRDAALQAALEQAGVSMAVNQQMALGDVAISNDDEIAFMSALSGG